jgi:hypothetical protein
MSEHAQAKVYYEKAITVYEYTHDLDNPEIKRTKDNINKMVEALAVDSKSSSPIFVVIGILFSWIIPLLAYLLCR